MQQLTGTLTPKIQLTGTLQAEAQLSGIVLTCNTEEIEYANEKDIVDIFKGE